MNPFSLLQKGHTFVDMASRHGAYKVMEGNALPNFTGGKRPACSQRAPQANQRTLFDETSKPATAPIGEAPAVAAPAPEPVKPTPTSFLPSPFAQAAVKKDESTPKKRFLAGIWRKTVFVCKRWAQRVIFGRKGRLVTRPTVQTELALEKVTVMKNDLTEDDLEVVLVQRKVGRGEKPLARLSKMEMTGEAWNRLTAPFRKKGHDSAASPKAETKAPELGARA